MLQAQLVCPPFIDTGTRVGFPSAVLSRTNLHYEESFELSLFGSYEMYYYGKRHKRVIFEEVYNDTCSEIKLLCKQR